MFTFPCIPLSRIVRPPFPAIQESRVVLHIVRGQILVVVREPGLPIGENRACRGDILKYVMLNRADTAERLELAVEDRFVVVKLADRDAMLPGGDVFEAISDTLVSFTQNYTFLCDFTKFGDYAPGESNVTSDAADAVRILVESGASILCTRQNENVAKRWFGERAPILTVKSASLPLHFAPIRLDLFQQNMDFEDPAFTWDTLPTKEEFDYLARIAVEEEELTSYENFIGELSATRAFCTHPMLPELTQQRLSGRRWLEGFIHGQGRNSLLTEFAIQVSPEYPLVTPYHTYAAFPVETPRSLIVAQPAILARRTQNLLTDEIRGLEILVNTEGIREDDIQRYLERHPNILRALGYREIFAQVVLQRDDGTSLRPDFMLRPVGNDWCDILDIKLPKPQPLVGGRDRLSLSHGLHQLGAQLREYGRYFEDERYARRVEQILGIKCYRPSLIGIVGRDLRIANDRQVRAAMTMYENTKIVTFDELIRIARSRILI